MGRIRHLQDHRGRHKKSASRETLKWQAEHLIPERPSWMDPATYARLAALRERLL